MRSQRHFVHGWTIQLFLALRLLQSWNAIGKVEAPSLLPGSCCGWPGHRRRTFGMFLKDAFHIYLYLHRAQPAPAERMTICCDCARSEDGGVPCQAAACRASGEPAGRGDDLPLQCGANTRSHDLALTPNGRRGALREDYARLGGDDASCSEHRLKPGLRRRALSSGQQRERTRNRTAHPSTPATRDRCGTAGTQAYP